MSSILYEAIVNPGIGSKYEGLKKLSMELKNVTTQLDLINVLKRILEMDDIKPESLAKILMLQKVMGASEAALEDLAKVLRIQNAILRHGVSADVLSRTINEALKPRKKQLIEKLKQPLSDVISTDQLSITGSDVTCGQVYQKAMKSSSHADDNKIKEIFDNAMKVAGLSSDIS